MYCHCSPLYVRTFQKKWWNNAFQDLVKNPQYFPKQWWNNYFQDLVKNPQYSLVLRKKTAAVNYFSYANSSTMMYQSILWERFKDDPNLFAENYEMADNILLQNSYKVFFDSALGGAKTSMPNYPCLIHGTSKILEKVFFDWT